MNEFRQFREAIHRAGERSEIPRLQAILAGGRRSSMGLTLRWAAVAAVMLMLAAVPAYESAQRQRELDQEKADALLMEQVNANLSRSVPRAMAPLMKWGAGR
jgi:hypothetical protein